MPPKPLMLLIRDGWGEAPDGAANAVTHAKTPNMDRLYADYPVCLLEASGRAVGVRDGEQGSSEVGHLNMGAGRIVMQEILRVDNAIENGSLFKTPRLVEAVTRCKQSGAAFHLMGLVQNQGVHATQDHLFALIRFLAKEGVENVFIHFFSDGRDTPPQSAKTFLKQLEEVCAEAGVGKVASVMGRYWAMDRAENWERTEKAFLALTQGKADYTALSAEAAIDAAYARAEEERAAGDDIVETDEFIRPTLIVDSENKPIGLIESGDAVLHFNYRQDRAFQLSRVFFDENFTEFDRGPRPDVFYMGLTRYWDEFNWELIPPMSMNELLGQVLAEHNLRQLRIAEFQKFRHVTSFFNGKIVEPFAGEDRIEVESITIPEDQKPEMSAYEVTDLVLKAVNDGIAAARTAAEEEPKAKFQHGENLPSGCSLDETYDVIVLNFANCDMVGHTGVFEAAVKAVEAVDTCLGKAVDAVLAKGGAVIVTSDHGNAETMAAPDGSPQTAHTTNLVTCTLVSSEGKNITLREKGILADVAPTMLQLLGIAQPAEMTAESLITD